MSLTQRTLLIACLTGVAIARLSGAGPSAGNTTLAPAANAPLLGGMPVVTQHKYRMLAKVRPFLFWISKDDVGGARISWHGDENGGFGVQLLIGSDPQRAPRQINRWGYIAEQVRGTDARVIGVMKQSNEQTVEDAEKQIGREGSQGGYVYRAIQGASTDRDARAEVTTVRVERDLTFRDIDPLLALVSGPDAKAVDGQARSVTLPAGTRPGFLVALRDLMKQCADAYSQPNGSCKPSSTPTPYVYYGVFYDLTMKSADLLKTATIDGQHYTNVARSSFEIRNRSNGETTRFQLTYGTAGPLTGIPVHVVYQARWWFEVQLFLDDHTNF